MIPALLGALLVGLTLGLLGSGGSILTVPILRYLLHHDHKAAIAESLAIVGVISASGFLQALRGRRATIAATLGFGLPGMGGAFVGALLARRIPGYVQFIALAVVMLAAASMMVRRKTTASPATSTPTAPPDSPSPLLIASLGLAVGAMTGLVGIGGGFLIVPALVLGATMPMRLAVGTSLGVITLNCAVGFSTYLTHLPPLDWRTIRLFCLIGVAGAFIGQRLGGRLPQATLRRFFAFFIFLIAIFMLWEELAHS